MAGTKTTFTSFLESVPQDQHGFVMKLHEYMLNNNCAVGIKEAKNGYVASYTHITDKRVTANYVFRKKGLIMRLYADNIQQYADYLQELPQDLKNDIASAPPCKRMIDPGACNPRCLQGFDFFLNGARHQKCRNSCFMILVAEKNNRFLENLVRHELKQRNLRV